MADQIAIDKRVLLVDCELTDKQSQMRYTDSETGTIHLFPEGLYRAEINPMILDLKVSDLLEKNATPEARAAHLDLADWLIEFLQDNK